MRRVLVALALLIAVVPSAFAAFLTTSQAGDLVFEAISGSGATSTQEFGLGTPPTSSSPSQRQVIFTFRLFNEHIDFVTPSPVVNMGHFAAGSALDFYQYSSYNGGDFAFSSQLGAAASPSDRVVFLDTDNSLGLGGGVIEVLGVDDWIFHLDDAASFRGDDDDNEMVFRVHVVPDVQIPEPASIALVCLGLAALRLNRWRDSKGRL